MTDTDMGLLFSFPDQSETFVLGFEAGQLFQRIEAGEPEIDCGLETGIPLHEANLECVQRMAAARNYRLEVGTAADGWVPVRLTFASKPAPALRIVGGDDD